VISARSETSVSVTAHGVGALLGSSNLSIFALKFNLSKVIIHSCSYTVQSVVWICASLSYILAHSSLLKYWWCW